MNESSSRLRTPKTLDEEKDCLSIPFQNLRLHEQMGVADFSRMARPKSAQDLHHLARRTVQRWRLGVDVQELTESIEIMNAKSLNYWQEVANKLPISRVDDTPHRHFAVLSGCDLKRFLVILTDYERFHLLYLFSSVFQGVTFYKCNVKVVMNCSNCDHMWISILYTELHVFQLFLLHVFQLFLILSRRVQLQYLESMV